MRRRLRLWRAAAVIGCLVAVFAIIAGDSSERGFPFKRDQIARVTIEGLILDNPKQQKIFHEIAKAAHVKAVLLRVNSPGGTTAGSEALFLAIRKLAARKPVVAVLGTVAASGGYIAAIAADRIVARGNTITGSIGVIFQWAQVSALLDKLGVKVETVKSGPLKGQPSPFSPTSDEARKATEELVRDSFNWFVKLVSDRRKIEPARARVLADGRVYTGRLAVANNLVDEIGGEDTAVTWLAKTKNISRDLKIVDWRWSKDGNLGLTGFAANFLAWITGTEQIIENLALAGKALKPERLSLDGLISVWQPER